MIPPQCGMLAIGGLPITLPLRMKAMIFASVLNSVRKSWPDSGGIVLSAAWGFGTTAEAARAVAVDASVPHVERAAGDGGSLFARNGDRSRIADIGQAAAYVRDEIGDLAVRDHGTPDGHVRLLRIRRLTKPVVDDRAELRDSQRLTHVFQRGHVGRYAALSLLTVTGRTGELHEDVRTHRYLRFTRVGAAVPATPAATQNRQCREPYGKEKHEPRVAHRSSTERTGNRIKERPCSA